MGPQDSSPKANSSSILPPPILCAATGLRQKQEKKEGRPRRRRAGRSSGALRPPGPAKRTTEPAHPHHGARSPARPPARRTLQPVPRRPPAPHPPARCPGVKRRKRPQETLGRLHGLGNGGRTQDQPGSIARPHRKCRRVPPGRPLPRPLRFPAGLGWACLLDSPFSVCFDCCLFVFVV